MGWDARFIFSLGFYLLHWLVIWPHVIVPSVKFISNLLVDWGVGGAAYHLSHTLFGSPISFWVMLIVELFLLMWFIAWGNKPDKKKKQPNKRALP